MKAYWGDRGIAPHIRILVTVEVSGQLHALATLPPGQNPSTD